MSANFLIQSTSPFLSYFADSYVVTIVAASGVTAFVTYKLVAKCFYNYHWASNNEIAGNNPFLPSPTLVKIFNDRLDYRVTVQWKSCPKTNIKYTKILWRNIYNISNNHGNHHHNNNNYDENIPPQKQQKQQQTWRHWREKDVYFEDIAKYKLEHDLNVNSNQNNEYSAKHNLNFIDVVEDGEYEIKLQEYFVDSGFESESDSESEPSPTPAAYILSAETVSQIESGPAQTQTALSSSHSTHTTTKWSNFSKSQTISVYALLSGENWDQSVINTTTKYFQILDENKSIVDKDYGQGTCVGSIVAKQGIHKWKFKVCNKIKKNGSIFIGIINNKRFRAAMNTKSPKTPRSKTKTTGIANCVWYTQSEYNGCMFSCNDGRLYSSVDHGTKCGDIIETGDYVDLELNMEKRTLTFGKNGYFWKPIANRVKKQNSYRMAVLVYKSVLKEQNRVQLISYIHS